VANQHLEGLHRDRRFPSTSSATVPGLADVRIHAGVLVFTLAVSVGTALLFGLVSAITVRSENAAGALVATRLTMGTAARRAASALVVAEVALAIVLLVGAGLILRSFARLVTPSISGTATRKSSALSATFAAPICATRPAP
jgi:hypothetical protein